MSSLYTVARRVERTEIQFGPLSGLGHAASQVLERPEGGPAIVVTDATVHELYGDRMREALEVGGWTARWSVLAPPGEGLKSMETVRALVDEHLAPGLERNTPVFAAGGGVVGDIGGFVAALLLRGLPVVQVPTTLIAQVDSAIGGKTGVNHPTGKNLIGAFHQPRLVYTDPAVLDTLEARDWRSGLAEVLKHALISGPDLLDWLDDRQAELLAGPDAAHNESMVRRAVAVKAAIVEEDAMETGRRAVLNLGHTFGHALERATGYGVLRHGEAVAMGLRVAARLSPLSDAERSRVERLAAPLHALAPAPRVGPSELVRAAASDKKRRDGKTRYVLLRAPGDPFLTTDLSEADVEAAWAEVLAARRAGAG